MVTQEKDIIKYIKKDKRYFGNEDLTDKFLDEIKKSERRAAINLLSEELPQDYKERFVSSCIIKVLKRNERLFKRGNSVKNQKKYKPVSYDIMNYAPINEKREILHSVKLRVVKILKDIEKDYPDKNYGEIYALRYIENKNLREISTILAKPEEEIAKDIFSMVEEVKKRIYN